MTHDQLKSSEIINKYFSYDYDEDQDLILFQEEINNLIHNYLHSKKISNHILIENLTGHFLDSLIPDHPKNLNSYLTFLSEVLLPNIVNVCKPTYMGHMTSMIPNFFQYLAQFITQLNMNVVKVETSKIMTLLERQTIAMLHRLVFHCPDAFYKKYMQDQKTNMGIIVSGGTIANITALWIARNNALKEEPGFNGVQNKGMQKALNHFNYNDAVIIGSNLMHYSMDKMSSLLGMGLENIIKVKLNSEGSIDIHELEKVINLCRENKKLIISIIGIAGTTETGKIDDLQSMAEIAKKYNIHFHVDAAWGGPILFSDRHKHLLQGIELADSVIVCGHKQLFLPQGVSMVLCKDPDQINCIKFTTEYQAREESYDLGKHSPEGSRPAFSLFLHAGLMLIGKKGYEYLIDEGMRKAAFLANLIRKNDAFELIEEPQTNIVNYRFIPEEFREKCNSGNLSIEDHHAINSINEALQDEELHQGKTFISRSILSQSKYGRINLVALRAVISNPLTTEKEIEELLKNQIEIGGSMHKLSRAYVGFSGHRVVKRNLIFPQIERRPLIAGQHKKPVSAKA